MSLAILKASRNKNIDLKYEVESADRIKAVVTSRKYSKINSTFWKFIVSRICLLPLSRISNGSRQQFYGKQLASGQNPINVTTTKKKLLR